MRSRKKETVIRDGYEYTAEDSVCTVTVGELMERFRNVERFIAFCRECPNYGRSWACPPFEFDADAYLSRWRYARVIATRITPVAEGLPVSEASRFIRGERLRLDNELLVSEAGTGGRAFSFVGSCLYCHDNECTRPCGLPCRHPERIRPSLEAFGFDIAAITEELFSFRLLWPCNGQLPSYLTIVTALFHD